MTQENETPEIDESEELGIPANNRVKRKYTLSEAALEQRRAASRRPKGDAVARNAWKTGEFARGRIQHKVRPCLSSCPQYPCEIVETGGTAPGQDCLDKAETLKIYRAITAALSGEMDDFKDVASVIIAEEMQTLLLALEAIQQDGATVREEIIDKDGNQVGWRFKAHPAFSVLPKLIANLNMTPADMMITPKAIAKQGDEDEAAQTLANILSKVGERVKPPASDDE